jgi:hypothetical protein
VSRSEANHDPEGERIGAWLRQWPPVHPPPGFARRWLVRLEQHRERRRRGQARWVLAGLLAGSLLAALLLGIGTLRVAGSPAGLAEYWIRTAVNARNALLGSYLLARDLGGILPALIGGTAGAVTLAWASALWFAALYRYSFANVPNGGRE